MLYFLCFSLIKVRSERGLKQNIPTEVSTLLLRLWLLLVSDWYSLILSDIAHLGSCISFYPQFNDQHIFQKLRPQANFKSKALPLTPS